MPALSGKSLVVIGGTTGLGLSAARAFVAAGARVIVVGRNAESGAVAQAVLGNAGIVLCADACDPATAPRAIDEAVRVFGGFHGLYHVAGGSGRRAGDGPKYFSRIRTDGAQRRGDRSEEPATPQGKPSHRGERKAP